MQLHMKDSPEWIEVFVFSQKRYSLSIECIHFWFYNFDWLFYRFSLDEEDKSYHNHTFGYDSVFHTPKRTSYWGEKQCP